MLLLCIRKKKSVLVLLKTERVLVLRVFRREKTHSNDDVQKRAFVNWNPNSRITVARLCVIAMTAAMKNVLSPISEAKIIDAERTKPSSKSMLLVLDENIFDVV